MPGAGLSRTDRRPNGRVLGLGSRAAPESDRGVSTRGRAHAALFARSRSGL